MSMMEDPMVTCPFDESHRFTRKRIQFHIVKCSKNQSMVGKYKCPFNSVHIIPASEILVHVKECESAAKVQNEYLLRREKKCFSGEVTMDDLKAALDKILPENDEWQRKHELNRPGPAYDPEAVSATRAVYRPHVTMLESKAKREKLRMKERQRYNALADELSNAPQPLRRPKTESVTAALTREENTTETDEERRKPFQRQPKSNSQPETTTSESINSNSTNDIKTLELTSDDATKTFQEMESLEEQEKIIRSKRNELCVLIQSDPLTNKIDYPKIARDLEDLQIRERAIKEQQKKLIESLKKIATGVKKVENNNSNVANGAIKKVYNKPQKNYNKVDNDDDNSSTCSNTSNKSNPKTDKMSSLYTAASNASSGSSSPSYAAKVSQSHNNSNNKNKNISPNTRPGRRLAANFGPSTSQTSDNQGWERVGNKPQCGRGIIHAFQNANSPNVGTSRQPRS